MRSIILSMMLALPSISTAQVRDDYRRHQTVGGISALVGYGLGRVTNYSHKDSLKIGFIYAVGLQVMKELMDHEPDHNDTLHGTVGASVALMLPITIKF